MIKKEEIKNIYISILVAITLIILLSLIYSYTSLFPNCGDCWFDNIKGEKAYIKSQLRHTNDRVYLAEDLYQVIDGTKKEFLIGVMNKFDKSIKLQVDIKEVYPPKQADVIKSGLFEYDYQSFILEPKEIRIIPVNYSNDGFIGNTKFVAYVRDIEYPYGDTRHNYTHISIYINVKSKE